jgi:hypothetical protein
MQTSLQVAGPLQVAVLHNQTSCVRPVRNATHTRYQSLSWLINFSPLKEPEGSSPFSQQPATVPYPEANEARHLHIQFI